MHSTKQHYQVLNQGKIDFNEYDVTTSYARNHNVSGLWCFGAVFSAESGVVLVLDPTTSTRVCISRTQAVAEPFQDTVLVTGAAEHVHAFSKHVQEALALCETPDAEIQLFVELASLYAPMVKLVHLTQYACVASTDMAVAGTGKNPAPGRYPSNVSVQARALWDEIVTSPKYLEKTANKNTLHKWQIAGKLFLERCHRRGVSPFQGQGNNIAEINERYTRQRNLASLFERQLLDNASAEGLVQDKDRGVFKYAGVKYLDKRYVLVLESQWELLASASKLTRYLVRDEHFQEQGKYVVHDIASNTKQVITVTGDVVNVQIQFSFTKDVLSVLGVSGSNRLERLHVFDAVARAWANTRKFRSVK